MAKACLTSLLHSSSSVFADRQKARNPATSKVLHVYKKTRGFGRLLTYYKSAETARVGFLRGRCSIKPSGVATQGR